MSLPRINVTIPVFNEAGRLHDTVNRLLASLAAQDGFRFEIAIADNGSTDGTLAVAQRISRERPEVEVVHLREKGRGRALKCVWAGSQADVLTYMDCDLSSDLASFPSLVRPVLTGEYQLAVGSRLLEPSLTTRGFKREVVSRCYNLIIRALFGVAFSDAQCGFKAIGRQAALELLPLVEDNHWFFDTELLLLAEARRFRILDLPVRWVEEPASHVAIWSTAMADIRGLLRMRRTLRRAYPGSARLQTHAGPRD